jgi:hypothetical protein
MFNRLKEILIGPPLPNQKSFEKRLNKVRALAAFSPDALSSIAYANQEIYLGLLVAGSMSPSLRLRPSPISRPSTPILLAAAPTSWRAPTWGQSQGWWPGRPF